MFGESKEYLEIDRLQSKNYSGKRVLLVEDNEINMEITIELLTQTGVMVETAENGRLAVERVREMPEGYYDLIFMDIQMLEMNVVEQRCRRGNISMKLIKCIIILVIAFEIVGMAVNHVSASLQTKGLKEVITEELSSVKIIDTYSETGNTSGTGNHVDMLSIVVFKADDSLSDIEKKLKKHYNQDEWGFWIEEVDEIKESHEQDEYHYPFYDQINVPNDLEHCYLVSLNQSAPFADNIEGH